MWDAIIEGLSPHLVAGTIMVAAMGGMMLVHRWWGKKHKATAAATPLQILQERFARGEIDAAEYEARRKLLET